MNMSFFNFSRFSSRSRTKKGDLAAPPATSLASFFSRSPLASPRPVSPTASSSKLLYLTPPFVGTSLVKGNFTPIVALPRFVDLDEWLASNIFDFFFYLNTFYGSLSDFCQPQTCPVLSADAGIEYPWVDSQKKSHRIPASQHIDLIMTFLEQTIYNESIFPTKDGVPFPPDFKSVIQNMARQIFRVYAHLFHSHYHTILHLRSEGHFHSQFAHFTAFVRNFQLLGQKDLTPLAELIAEMESQGLY
ncbi:Maintenance of ploidy protein mob2 [Entomophthora muscae]|uniref:Maintenance of ploidy protein mob2 n=1 Tax=Entomophthora muscae TaxID=34485 RepID=A0ACC2SBI2_9FUNG|nr:Maintenance of ploidy protein mob2 [Entomophthora muscae]